MRISRASEAQAIEEVDAANAQKSMGRASLAAAALDSISGRADSFGAQGVRRTP